MRKILILILILLIAFTGLLSACGINRNTGERGTLSIASFEGGYGGTWPKALAEAYQNHNPNVKIIVEANPLVRDDAVTALQTGISSVDIFFIDGANVGGYCETYDSIADLNELYESKPKAGDNEEDTLIKDKFWPEIVEEMKYGGDREPYVGNFYTAPAPSGPSSLILNIDALNLALGEGNWEIPLTTNQMMALADRIKAANAKVNVAGINHTIYPFLYSGNSIEYWKYLYFPWIAQYDGVQAFRNMMNFKIGGVYTQAAFNPPGKLLAYSLLERIVKRTNNYCDPTSMSNSYIASQKYFFQKRAAMYVTGDWLEREMETATEYRSEMKMIKPPVISDLAVKLEQQYSVSLGANAAEKDQKLAQIINAVDEGETSLEGVDQRVFDAVKEARSIVYSLANNVIGLVPKSSVNKDLAIDFMRFMYSDEGIEIMLRESKGNLPVKGLEKFNLGEVSTFRQSVNDLVRSNIQYIFSSGRDPIRYRAGLNEYMGNEKPAIAFGKKTGFITAAEQLQKEISILNENWSKYLELVQ